MNYSSYMNSRDLSWNILIQGNICELPVSIINLCHQLNIKVKYYVPNNDSDGQSLIVKGCPIILVNKNCPNQRKRFTVAHELGHILLGHVGKYELVNREPAPNDNPIEHEANIFASRLLAPACVLWGCKIKNATEISNLCDISKKAADFRMERMKILYQKNKFLISPLERQVYKQFYYFILDHQYHQHLANS